MKSLKTALFCLGSIFLIANMAMAITINVPADFPTIQDAINAANDCDIVQVDAGTYYENINFNGKIITVESIDGPAVTIIDGGGNNSVVKFNSGENYSTQLIGFTITNGHNNYGGGIRVGNNSTPSLKNLIITNNTVSSDGAGICCFGSSPSIKNTKIFGNTASHYGGGAAFWNESSPILENVEIFDNVAPYGGGIQCHTDSSPLIYYTSIHNNTAYNHGGGIHCKMDSYPQIVDTTITDNTANQGGGIYLAHGSAPKLISSILWDNAPSEIHMLVMLVHPYDPPNQIAISCSNIAGGRAGIVNGNTGGNTVTWGSGNINQNPDFIDPAGYDYGLAAGSPCIDTGCCSGVGSCPCIYNGSWRDMGAFEGCTILPH